MVYHPESWMQTVQNTPLWSLVLPGTHNSCAYKSKNYLLNFRRIMDNQHLTIYEQLMMGVRVLDIRICFRKSSSLSQNEYWVCHTFLVMPLDEALDQINTFLKEHPTELVVLEIRAGLDPLNLDGCVDKSIVEGIDDLN